MKLRDLAKAAVRSVPAVMTIQKKYALPVYEEYSAGYLVLLKKIIYLVIFSVTPKEIKTLIERERGLLELLKVDTHLNSPNWFESLCTTQSGSTRLLLTGYDVGHAVQGNAVQTGLDFKDRQKELFEDHEMGADALKGLARYAETLERIKSRTAAELTLVQEAEKWYRQWR